MWTFAPYPAYLHPTKFGGAKDRFDADSLFNFFGDCATRTICATRIGGRYVSHRISNTQLRCPGANPTPYT